MAKTIDSRVVEMKFNNKQFESGVKQSLNTIEKLKSALSKLTGANKNLGDIGKVGNNSGINAIAKSVEALEKRFSTLGIVGMQVIQKLTDGLMNTLGKGLNFVTEGIVGGGIKRAMNIENAHYQLQTLLKDESKVQQIMDNAMESVDGTAYAFDEAAKAASMFAASGIKAGEPMVNALKGISGTAAMTNADFERISLIFTSVAGQGRLMGDQLLQLSSLGLNAPATIADYFNRIDESSTKASEGVRKTVKELTNGKKVTEADIRSLVSDGEIKFNIFAEAMYDAFGESAQRANETFNGSMSNIRAALARIGAEFVSPLIEQNGAVVKMLNAVRERINDLKAGIVFNKEIGNVNALSKRFTDMAINAANSVTKFMKSITAVDIGNAFKVFYNVFDSIVNVVKALFSYIKPLAQAFSDVFLSFKVGDLIKATGSLKDFTAGLKLTEGASNALRSVFTGLFSVIKLLIDGFLGVIKAIFPIGGTFKSLGSLVLTVAGAFGDGLVAITNWIRTSSTLNKVYSAISSAIKVAAGVLGNFINTVVAFVKKAVDMGIVGKAVDAVADAFAALGKIASPIIEGVINGVKALGGALLDLIPKSMKDGVMSIGDAFSNFKDSVMNLKFEDVSNGMKSFCDRVKELVGSIKGNAGLNAFIDNLSTFGSKIKEAFDFTKITDNIKAFKSTVQSFVDWFKSTFGKIFEGFSLGGALGATGGLGLVYALVKMTDLLEKASKKIEKIPAVLGSLSDALKSYSTNLKADSIKKISMSILAMAAAITILSFADTDKAMDASKALSLLAASLLGASTLLVNALNTGHKIENAAQSFARNAGKALNKVATGVKWKLIGSSFKDFAASLLMIIGAIAAVGFLYDRDKEGMEKATIAVGAIAIALTGLMTLMTFINKKMGTGSASGFLKSAIGILAITGALNSIIKAYKKVLDIELPSDWGIKLGILGGLLTGVAGLTIALGAAAKIAGTAAKIKAGPLLAVCVLLVTVVGAMNKVFNMKLPDDLGSRFAVLITLFGGLSGILVAMGGMMRLAGGAIKVAPTLLALAVDIAAITIALGVLSLMPADKMTIGALALAAILATIGYTLSNVGEISGGDAPKTVLAMAITVAAIAASLAVLSMIPWQDLIVAAGAMSTVLLSVAAGLLAASKLSNEGEWKTIVAMIGVAITIAGSLYILSSQPWDGMLVAATAMSATLLAFAAAFMILSKSNSMNMNSVGQFLAVSLAVLPIAVALYALSNQPWQGMLAAAAAMSAVFLSMSAAFIILSKSNVNVTAIAAFVAGAIALIPISAALNMLSGQSWNALIPAATALIAVMTGIAAALVIASKGGTNLAGVLGFVAASVSLIPIAAVIKQLSGLSWEEVAKGLVALAGGLTVIGVAGLAGTAIAPGLLALSAALLVFAAAIAAVGLALPLFVDGLTVAVQAVAGFVSDVAGKVSEMIDAGKNLILGLAEGIASGLGSVIDTISGVANNVIDTVKGIFGIHSPSTIFEAMGINIDEGFVQGLMGGSGSIDSTVQDVFGGIADDVDLSSLTGLGEEATSLFTDGLGNGQGDIQSMLDSVMDSSGTDLSSYFDLGQLGGDNLAGGLDSQSGNIDSIIQSLVDPSGTDVNPFSGLGNEAANNFGSGVKKNKSGIDSIVKQTTQAPKIDMGEYTNLGKTAADKFASGMKSGTKGSASEVASNIAKTMSNAISSAIKGTDFSSSGKSITSSISSGIKASQEKASSAAKAVAQAAAKAVKNQNEQFKSAGSATITALANGIKSKASTAENAVKNIMKNAAKAVKSQDDTFKKYGETSINKYVAGVKAKANEAKSAAESIAKKMVSALDKQASSYKEPGTKAAKNFINAINNAMKSGISSTVNNMTTYGKRIVEGIAKGINASSSIATRAASQLAKKIDQQVKSDLDIHSPSKVAQLRGEQFGEGLANGILNKKKRVTDVTKTLTAAMVASCEEGVRDLDAVLYRMGLLPDKPDDGTIKTWDDYWKKLLAVKQKGVDAEKYMGMDLVAFRKSIEEESAQIMENYNNQVQQNIDAMLQQFSLVSEVDKSMTRTRQEQAKYEYEVAKKEAEAAKAAEKASKNNKKAQEENKITLATTKDIAKLLKEQTKTYDQYTSVMKKLKKKLKDTELWNEIKDMGIDSLGLLRELNQKSDKELQKIVDLYDERLAAATEAAKVNMGDLTKETQKQLDALYDINEDAIAKDKNQKNTKQAIEEAFWNKLLATKQAGAEAEKYADITMTEFREHILEESTKILEEYTKQFESSRDSIMSQIGLFDEVAEKSTVTKDQLIKNLQDQVNAYNQFNQVLDSVVTRLEGRNVVDYLKTLGVNSIGELQAINSMTDAELKQYADLYDTKLKEAGNIASTQLSDIQKETEQKLGDLFGTVEKVDLTKFTETFDGTIQSVQKFILELEGPIHDAKSKLEKSSMELMEGVSDGLKDGLDKLGDVVESLGGELMETLSTSLETSVTDVGTAMESVVDAAVKPVEQSKSEFEKGGKTAGTAYSTGVNNTKSNAQKSGQAIAQAAATGVTSNTQAFTNAGTASASSYANSLSSNTQIVENAGKQVANAGAKGVEDAEDDFRRAGIRVVQGFANGMTSQINLVQQAASQISNAATTQLNANLNIHSPSRVMQRIGGFAGLGFVNGLLDYVRVAGKAAEKMGHETVKGAEEGFNNLTPIFEDEVGQPVITPEVDLTNVIASAAMVNKMFNDAVAASADSAAGAGATMRVRRRSADGNNNIQNGNNSGQSGNINYEFVQNNYSPKALSEAEIYRYTKNQFSLFRMAVNSR